MKKWIALLLVVCMGIVLTACSTPATQNAASQAPAVTPEPTSTPVPIASGNYSYIVLDDNTACITGYRGEETNLTIPDALDGHKVTAIGD